MKILLVCDAIAPLQGIASIRWTKISKYLIKNHGDEASVDVLTTKKNYDDPHSFMRLYPKDVLLERDMRYFNNYYAVPVENRFRLSHWYKRKVIGKDRHFFTSEDAFRHDFKSKVKSHVRTLYESYYNYAIADELWKFIRDKINAYDCVISSYNPMWPFMLCSKIASAQRGLKWIADFRDTCGRNNVDMSGYAQWHTAYAEKHSVTASAVLQVNDFLYTHTDSRVPRYTVTNGYDPEEAYPPEKPDSFNLVYTGSLFGKQQDYRILYRALNELIAEGKMALEDVKVIYAGRYSEQAQAIAEQGDGLRFFVNLNEVSRQKARELQQKAAILIQAAFNIKDDYCAWTGKMYEYMIAGKPIVYIVNGDIPHSMPSEHMEQLGGVCYEACRHEETYGQLKSYILQKYEEWKRSGDVTVSQDDDYIRQYSYDAIAKRVWEILRKL